MSKKVIIKSNVGVAGKHYQPGDKPVTVSDEDARYLIARGIADPVKKKPEERK